MRQRCTGYERPVPGTEGSMTIIDADSHINSPPDLWQKRVAAKYRERAPRLVDMGGFDGWTAEGRPPTPLPCLSFAAGKKPEELVQRQIRFAEQDPGCSDARARWRRSSPWRP